MTKMKRTALLALTIQVCVLIASLNGQSCNYVNNVLECNVTSSSFTVDNTWCSGCTPSSVKINYSKDTVLTVNIFFPGTLSIVASDSSSDATLRISSLNTNASRVEITIVLSSGQLSVPLFPTGSSISASTTTLQITVMQKVSDASNFKVFDRSTMNFAGYELVFNSNICSGINCGTLNLENLVGLSASSLASVSIQGNGHVLAMNSAQMSSMNNVLQLSLNNFRLYGKILNVFPLLQTFNVENCEYNRSAQFLQSSSSVGLTTLLMKNNNPLDLVLPNGNDALKYLNQLNSITLIEPKLNSSCLNAFTAGLASNLRIIVLHFGQYQVNDFEKWLYNKPNAMYFTIHNIPNLNVFPSGFCNRLYALTRLTLQGSFGLALGDVCVFAGFPRASYQDYPVIVLNSTLQGTYQWNRCTNTYIYAINVINSASIRCPPTDSDQHCSQWADQTNQCGLESLESSCVNTNNNVSLSFYYQSSALRQFLTNRLWQSRSNSTGTPSSEAVNVGAIVGAICGLLIAIVILSVTIFCVCQRRNNPSSGRFSSSPGGKYQTKSGSNGDIYTDPSNVSIATSKTGHSSLAPLEKSFFPPVHPRDVIAPPLYSAAPSVGSQSVYGSPSAPSAPRDSMRTQTTHIYETLDT